MTASVAVVLTVDVEGEWLELPGEQGKFDIARVLFAVESLETNLHRLEAALGTRIPVTWFIRCDDSVAKTAGDAAGLLQSLEPFIMRRSDAGDEFGLHPHLYRDDHGKWVSETDPARQADQVVRAASAWKRYFGSDPALCRMGEAIMNNVLADALDNIGAVLDSSALPGRKRFDSGFQFDWTGAPTFLYRPARVDYRRPASGGEGERNFLEAPFTMLPIFGPNDNEPINRYCNLAYRPEFVRDAMRRFSRPEYIIAVVHPHELLAVDHQHPLISHDPRSLGENIGNLAESFGRLEPKLLSALL